MNQRLTILKDLILKELVVKTSYEVQNPLYVHISGHATISRTGVAEQCCVVYYTVGRDEQLKLKSIESYDLSLSYADLTDILITIEQQLIRQGVKVELETAPEVFHERS